MYTSCFSVSSRVEIPSVLILFQIYPNKLPVYVLNLSCQTLFLALLNWTDHVVATFLETLFQVCIFISYVN